MIFPWNITKENAEKYLHDRNKVYVSMFVSGSDIHSNPRLYKYYWWIYSFESKEESANEVFYNDEYKLTTSEFMKESKRLEANKISFAYVNEKIKRQGCKIWNYDLLKKKYPNIKFAPSYEDDTDELWNYGHK